MKKLFSFLGILLLLTACTQNGNTETKNSDETVNVGIIQFAEHVALDRAREGFVEKLEDENLNVNVDVVNVQGDVTLVPQAANNMKSNKVDIIYAIGTPAAQGAMGQISDIPIIFSAVTDPVNSGLVESNEKPGGNVTGVSDYFPFETQLDLFLKDFPDVKTIGVLYSTGEANSEVQIEDARAVLESRGMTLKEVGITSSADVPTAMSTLVNDIDAYFAITDNLASSSASVIGQILLENKIPSFAAEQGPAENGLLLSDGIDYKEQGVEAAKEAIEILKGKSPSEIPVFFSKTSNRYVNEETEKALGIKVDR